MNDDLTDLQILKDERERPPPNDTVLMRDIIGSISVEIESFAKYSEDYNKEDLAKCYEKMGQAIVFLSPYWCPPINAPLSKHNILDICSYIYDILWSNKFKIENLVNCYKKLLEALLCIDPGNENFY
jgi:hypothetical protein